MNTGCGGVMRFLVYMTRWQLSGVVLAPCIALIPNSPICSAVVGNLIGGLVFWWIDKLIFKKAEVKGDK